MTKEELVNEAEKSLDKRLGTYAYIRKQDCYTNYVDGYIDSAEPREKQIAELEQENTELKTKKIPQLERRIASIRGSHSVDAKKLNARIEQVERLKKEKAELKTVIALKDEAMGCIETDFNTFKSQAKEIIRDFISVSIDYIDKEDKNYSCIVEAEQFLNEVGK